MSSETKPEGSGTSQVKLREIARLIGVEAGQVQVETPVNRIKGLVPKVDTIPRSGKKARLYLLTVGEGADTSPCKQVLEEFGRFVTVPVAVWRAQEAGSVREGDALVYVPGDEEGERVYHFRVSGELLEVGERSDPGEREVAVKVAAPKEDAKDWLDGLRAVDTGESPPPSTPLTPRRRRRRSDGPRES